ncbi:MAG: DNA polymerase III subunit gamma/tau [Chloroflexi bacterium]|nr:DNA polymerase III subunit gamma/tau [Chloroflexota bacterium]
MSQALYRKYRPQGWAEVIGQDHVVQTLKNAVAADRVGHAYLFAGPRGTGKTTLARLLAKAVNCLNEDRTKRPCSECENCKAVSENRFLDLIEIDAASNTSVDDVRDLRDKINFSPSQGKYKIYIIDEVHMLSTAAFNALLKTLEEPPPHAIFVLATTEIHKIPATVLSRCQRHEFRRVPVNEIVANLRQIVKAEKIQADDDALAVIAHQASGSLRDAQSLLDQLASTGTKITLQLTQTVLGTATSQTVLDLIASIRENEAGRGLETIHHALDSGADPRSLARQVVEYLRGLMLVQLGNGDQVETTKDVRERMTLDARSFSTPNVLRMMKAFNSAAVDTRGGWQPSLSLELALAESLEIPSETPVSNSGSKAAPVKQTKPSAENQTVKKESAKSAALSEVEGSKKEAKVSLAEINKSWKDIRAVIKPAHPAVEALLNSCKPMDVRGDELMLGFQSETVRGLMDKPENLDVTQKAIADVLGVTLTVKCVVTNAKGKLPPHVSADGMVATALDHGGEIVDVQE